MVLKISFFNVFPTRTWENIWKNFFISESGRALSSQSEGCGFDPRPMLGGRGVKAMPGMISAPNSGSL